MISWEVVKDLFLSNLYYKATTYLAVQALMSRIMIARQGSDLSLIPSSMSRSSLEIT